MIHSSSATIGIVMGLGSAGVLDWNTAVAFSLGADLGTTITSWMASLNLSKNAKRAAYAHISFNIIGVCVMLPLFFPSMQVLTWVMGYFGGDPGVPVIVNGKETFPLVPVAVGLYSTFFNIFNTVAAVPVRRRVRTRAVTRRPHRGGGRRGLLAAEIPRSAPRRRPGPGAAGDPERDQALRRGGGKIPRHRPRHRECAGRCRGARRRARRAQPRHPATTPRCCSQPNLPYAHANVVASLIEEEDFTASLGESLYQVARRVERHPFSAPGKELVNGVIDELAAALQTITADGSVKAATNMDDRMPKLTALRERVLKLGSELPAEDRGAILAILGSAERAFYLIDRIDAERRSVARVLPAARSGPHRQSARRPGQPGGRAGLISTDEQSWRTHDASASFVTSPNFFRRRPCRWPRLFHA